MGVMSSLLWCIVVDGLLRGLHTEGCYIQEYAEYFIMLVGTHLQTLMGLTRSKLRIVEFWCDSSGLMVNPEKNSLVIFTKKCSVES